MLKTALCWFLGTVFLCLVGFTFTMGRDPSTPNFEIFPDMVHSVPYDAFAANPVLPDGMTLQPSVPGTIARGELPLYYQPTPEDALRAGIELHNPYASEDEEALKRGARIYAVFCTPCHGGGGRGDGLVSQRGFPPPPSLFAPTSMEMKDGQMFHILTYGGVNMPSYAAQISREDRWKAILHVRDMQRREASAAAAALPQPATASANVTEASQPASTEPNATVPGVSQ